MVEAQTTFSRNIIMRLLLYLAETYRRIMEERKWNLYSSTPVKVPAPKLLVVYTGKSKNIPEVLCFSDICAEGEKSSLEIEARVIRRRGTNDILDQYIRFSEIVAEEEASKGRTAVFYASLLILSGMQVNRICVG